MAPRPRQSFHVETQPTTSLPRDSGNRFKSETGNNVAPRYTIVIAAALTSATGNRCVGFEKGAPDLARELRLLHAPVCQCGPG
eukprot:753608-Pyramimonas_sp.AAC.1